ncbi:MAG: S-adenosylmethionine decarboxylase [Gemmatimonadaceae bacterium]
MPRAADVAALVRRTMMAPEVSAYTHLIADCLGVAAAQLRDTGLLTGLLIAGAGAAGFATVGAPVVRKLPNDSIAAVLLLEGCHIAVHTFPERELLLLDVLAPATHDARKVVDVFARRLTAREIRSESHSRG